MPLVDQARLKKQIDSLLAQITEPDLLLHSILEICESYADLSYRPGNAVRQVSLLPSYHLPQLVMRQLENFMSRFSPQVTQWESLVDMLWASEYLEPRLLAAILLGHVNLSQAPNIEKKIIILAEKTTDSYLLDALLKHGTTQLRKQHPGAVLELIENWIEQNSNEKRTIGLHLMRILIEDEQFENLPAVFRILTPLVQLAPPLLHPALQEVIGALARRSPIETAFYLRQTMNLVTSQAAHRLVRRCLPYFSAEIQEQIKMNLQTNQSNLPPSL
ncbi:MAG TPA: DNA alkylation repair protein [Anaerolineaceae bacterium]